MRDAELAERLRTLGTMMSSAYWGEILRLSADRLSKDADRD